MDEPNEAEMEQLHSELSRILERLDRLGLFQAGAHVTMAIYALRPPKEGSSKKPDSSGPLG